MKAIIASDLHLTNNERDSYRMGVFKFLRQKIEKYKPDACFILGDLTDYKDKHPSKLVNDIAAQLVKTASLCDVYLLKGNHDYLEPKDPFFFFTTFLKSDHKIHYISDIMGFTINHKSVLFLPHTRTPEKDWDGLNLDKMDYIFLHQTLQGARASNGQTMEGLSYSRFDTCKGIVISGDIHVPQKIGKVNYIGSPYHITFGDSFKPRCILLDGDKITSLRFKTTTMHTIVLVDPEDLKKHKEIKTGDHVKVRIELKDLDTLDWVNKRDRVNEIGQELGIDTLVTEFVDNRSKKNKKAKEPGTNSSKWPTSDEGIYWMYCEKNGIEGKLTEIGKELLESV